MLKSVGYVRSPVDGTVLTMLNLPSPHTRRWVIRRKAEVVAAVRGGLLTLPEACARYRLTTEEFLAWEAALTNHGLPGLRVTHLQQYEPRALIV